MNSSLTRLSLAIAVTSALVFAAGCDNRSTVDDRAAVEPVNESGAQPASTTPPADPAVQGDAAYTADALPEGATGDGRRSDQPIDDTWITTKVKSSLLADSDVSGLNINVETVNGVVTLSGQVQQQAQIEHATRIARGIEGVTDVRTTDLVTNPNP